MNQTDLQAAAPFRISPILPAIALILTVATGTGAQDTSPTVTGFVQAGFNAVISEDPYGLLPVVRPANADYSHSFQLIKARLYFRGEVDDRVGYDIRGEFAGGFSLLAAFATYRLSDRLTLYGGQMLKPFGQDRTRARHRLLSFDRTYSTIATVNGLGYGNWDVGAMARIALENGGSLAVGLFNGRGAGATRDNDTGKNVAGRIVLPVGSIDLGGSVSYQSISTLPDEGRENLALGLDFLMQRDRFSLLGELLSASDWSNFDPVTGDSPTMLGAALTLSVPINPLFGARSTDLVIRIERVDRDIDAGDDEVLLVVPNLNLAVSDAGRFQLGLVYESPATANLDAALSGVLIWQVNFF
jgi:hypothetical protein